MISWESVRAIIFDVDGTLYDQHALRKRLLKEMLGYYASHPWRLQELKILYDFRRAREGHSNDASSDLENAQYEWAAAVSGVDPGRVRQVVREWIFQRPLRHLAACRYPGLLEFIGELDRGRIKTAFFSDYPANEKLTALGLPAGPAICATDINVNRLKPDPKSLLLAAEALDVPVGNCLCIGDRDDRDGEAARRAGMPYLLLGRKRSTTARYFQSYFQLIAEVRRECDSSGSGDPSVAVGVKPIDAGRV